MNKKSVFWGRKSAFGACGGGGECGRLFGMSVIRMFLLVWATFGAVYSVFALSSKEAKAALDATLKKANDAFTAEVRQAYLDYTEAVIREKYGPNKINETTWKWVKQRPQILSAVAAAEYPVNPNILLNFQRIGLALGHVRLDQWRQLALAYAIRWRDQPFPIDRVNEAWDPMRLERLVSDMRKGKGGDFALLADEDYPKVSDEERRLGEWIAGPQSLISTRPPLTIPELMEMPLHEINMMVRKKPDDPPMLTKFPNWDNVAYGGRLVPPYVDCTPTPQRAVLMKIFRNSRIPAKTDRPAFKMEQSEWPILLYLADLAQIDETSFIFNYFVTNKQLPPLGLGQKQSSTGQNDMTPSDPVFKYSKSNWHPNKTIRIYNGSKKDQGGRSWAWGLNAVNVAATAVAAPPDGKFYYMGSKGNYTYFMSCADNSFTGEGSSAAWYLPPPRDKTDNSPARSPRAYSSDGVGVLHRHFMGLATTLNQGLKEYEDVAIAMWTSDLLNLSANRRLSLLESAFRTNPLNEELLYRLAAEYRRSGDPKATIKMLNAARAYAATGLKLPVTASGAKTARGNIAKVLKGDATYQGVPVIHVNQSPWFFLTCADISIQYLRDHNGAGKEAFREELGYLQKAANGCGDKPIVRAIDTLRGLVE